jgi:anti-sigma B factor antagonist
MNTTYRVERTGANCQVSLTGSLTAIVVPELKEVLRRELEADARELVFDLSETIMIDSSGIGLLIATSNSVSQKQGTMLITNPQTEIYKLLSNMRLVSRLNVCLGTQRG